MSFKAGQQGYRHLRMRGAGSPGSALTCVRLMRCRRLMESSALEGLPQEVLLLVLQAAGPGLLGLLRQVSRRLASAVDALAGGDAPAARTTSLPALLRAGADLRQQRAALDWAKRAGCPWDNRMCAAAAASGSVALLQWMCGPESGCRVDGRSCAAAAGAGHLGLLQWLRARGCPWDEDCAAAAAGGGHLDVLRWARGAGCPWNLMTCVRAAETGQVGAALS